MLESIIKGMAAIGGVFSFILLVIRLKDLVHDFRVKRKIAHQRKLDERDLAEFRRLMDKFGNLNDKVGK